MGSADLLIGKSVIVTPDRQPHKRKAPREPNTFDRRGLRRLEVSWAGVGRRVVGDRWSLLRVSLQMHAASYDGPEAVDTCGLTPRSA